VVKVQVDPKSGAVRFDMKDPQLSVRGQDKLTAAAFAETLKDRNKPASQQSVPPAERTHRGRRANGVKAG
jgi:hypothetical protein